MRKKQKVLKKHILTRLTLWALPLFLIQVTNIAHAQSENGKNVPICGADVEPYRDLDFLVGEWEFFTIDGQKIADQTYYRREDGCLVLEDWTTLRGETGTGMNFVDPFTGNWRQVWMSPNFHIDYSGGITEPGVFVLEGHMFSNKTGDSSQIRGVYTQAQDGSVTKEFLLRSKPTEEWRQFFIGVARPVDASVNSAPLGDCTKGEGVYGQLKFLEGRYDYLSGDGTKFGETTYSSRADGCVILEEFTSTTGQSAIGTILVNPTSGNWEHTWRSEAFYFEMEITEVASDRLIFEGVIDMKEAVAKPIRGIWTREAEGVIAHGYETYDSGSKTWKPFFSGRSVPVLPSNE